MKQKIVTISNLIATYQERCGDIICANSGYSVKFLFDDEWADITTKTARFLWNGEYFDVEFTGDTCEVPVITKTDRCEVGVYAGGLSTTTGAIIPCRKSVLCKGGQPNPGTGQHYSNEAKAAAESAKASESVATAAAQQATAAAAQADALLGPAGSKINQLDKRVTNIEQGLPPEKFVVDGSTAYSKTVPENVCSSAMITKVGGMSHKSANLLDLSNCVVTADTTMVIGEGTLTVTGYIVQNTITHLIGGKTYTFKANSTRTSERGGGISIECYDSNSAKVYETYRQEVLNPQVTFTVPVGTVRTRFYFYGGKQGSTTSATYTDVMLNEGSTALPHEPYFEGLRHAKVTEIKSESANVLDIYGEEWGVTGWFTSIENGIKIDSFSKNSYEFTAKNNHINITSYSSGSLYPWLSKFIKLKPNTTYRLYQSADKPYVSIVGLNDIAVGTVGTKLTITGGIFNSGSYKHWMISFYGTGSANVMINYGDTALPFTPYAEYAPLQIPSAVQALPDWGLGVSAEVNNHIDWTERKYRHTCIGVVLDGSADEGWGIASDGLGGYYLALPENGAGSNVRSNRYKPTLYPWMEYGTIGATAQGVLWVTTETTSVEEWRSSLKSNPLEIVYERATPEVTDISGILPADNLIRVESGGPITPENEHGLAVPTEIIYQLRGVAE